MTSVNVHVCITNLWLDLIGGQIFASILFVWHFFSNFFAVHTVWSVNDVVAANPPKTRCARFSSKKTQINAISSALVYFAVNLPRWVYGDSPAALSSVMLLGLAM